MIADAFVIRLPDGTLHYARPGHVNALCGANRVSNGDRWTGTVEDVCSACVLLRGRDDEQATVVPYPRVSRTLAGTSSFSPAVTPYPRRDVECPDCGALWPINLGEPCPGCGLAEEDVEAGADFWIALGTGEL